MENFAGAGGGAAPRSRDAGGEEGRGCSSAAQRSACPWDKPLQEGLLTFH